MRTETDIAAFAFVRVEPANVMPAAGCVILAAAAAAAAAGSVYSCSG